MITVFVDVSSFPALGSKPEVSLFMYLISFTSGLGHDRHIFNFDSQKSLVFNENVQTQYNIRRTFKILLLISVASTSNMGQVISAFLAENEHEHEEDTVEQLQILQKLAAAKLEAKAIKLATDAFEDKCLPIVAVVDKVERYAVKAESAPASKVEECIGDIFQGHFLEGLKKAVCTGVSELLGNTSAGEQERSETHVVFANNTLLRVDYYCYKYEFGSHGLRDKFRNAFSYVVQVGVLDNIRVDPQIALYELGKSIGSSEEIRKSSEKLEEDANLLEYLYHVIHRLRNAAAEAGSDTSSPASRQRDEAHITSGGRSARKMEMNDPYAADSHVSRPPQSRSLDGIGVGPYLPSTIPGHNYHPLSLREFQFLHIGGRQHPQSVFDLKERALKTIKTSRVQKF